MQLFTLPYAGGQSSFYKPLIESIDSVEFVNFEYPGHGLRLNEKLCEDFNEIIRIFYNEFLEKYSGNDYSIIGYSMGSLVLVKLLKSIQDKKEVKNPKCVFICAHNPYTVIDFKNISEENIDEYVKENTINFNSVPDVLINNNTFWRVYLPIFKSDYKMISKFNIDNLRFKSDVSLNVFYGVEDEISRNIYDWNKYFLGNNEYFGFDGGHFFIKDHYNDVAKIISKKLCGD